MLLAHNRNLRDLLDDTWLAAAPPGAARRAARALLSRTDAHLRDTYCGAGAPAQAHSPPEDDPYSAACFGSPIISPPTITPPASAFNHAASATATATAAAAAAAVAAHERPPGMFDAAAQLDTSGIGFKFTSGASAAFGAAFAQPSAVRESRSADDAQSIFASSPTSDWASSHDGFPPIAKAPGVSAPALSSALAEHKWVGFGDEGRVDPSSSGEVRFDSAGSAGSAGSAVGSGGGSASLCKGVPTAKSQRHAGRAKMRAGAMCPSLGDCERAYEHRLLAFAAATAMPPSLGPGDKRNLAERYSFVQKLASWRTIDSSLHGQEDAAGWPVADKEDLLTAAEAWMDNKAAQCRTPDDFENFGSWGELLEGIRVNHLSNCFLGGEGATAGFVDAEMAQFAGLRWLATGEQQYLYWLGFARAAEIHPGTSILHAVGPLRRVPEAVSGAALQPLGAAWSVGARPFSDVPTPRQYALVYLARVHKMQTALGMPHARSAPWCLTAPGKVRAMRNRSSYQMRTGEIAHFTRGRMSYVEAAVWTFGPGGLQTKRMECKFRRRQEGSLSSSPGARLSAATEQEAVEIEPVATFINPVPQLQRLFEQPDVLELLVPGCGLSTRDLAVAHVLAGVAAQGAAMHASGFGLCAVGNCDERHTHGMWLPGPLGLGVLRASGWKVEQNGMLNWRRDAVSADRFALTDDCARPVGIQDAGVRTRVVCRRHLGDARYWELVHDIAQLVDEGDDVARTAKRRCLVKDYDADVVNDRLAAAQQHHLNLIQRKQMKGGEDTRFFVGKDFAAHLNRLPKLLWLAFAYVFIEILLYL